MNELIFKTIFCVMWFACGLIRMPHIFNYKKIEKEKSKNMKLETFLVSLVRFGIMIIPMIYVFSPLLDSFNFDLHYGIRWAGVLILGLDMIFFWWIHKALGGNWSPVLEVRKKHSLITEGPYKYIRHPMYTVFWIWVICQWLILSNWFVGISGVLAWAILYFVRTPEEEKMMIESFGQEYKYYMKNTKRIIPYVY